MGLLLPHLAVVADVVENLGLEDIEAAVDPGPVAARLFREALRWSGRPSPGEDAETAGRLDGRYGGELSLLPMKAQHF